MKIGIIGSGGMGGALGSIWAQHGHEVIFSFAREQAKLTALVNAAGKNSRVGTSAEAAHESDVIMLAVWPPALDEALQAAGSLDGKIIITCMSGLKPDFSGQTIGLPTDLTQSIAERIAELASGAHVVEAFNLTFAEILQSPSREFGDERPSLLYCGNDEAAKRIAAQLMTDAGYDAVDAGDLSKARALETLATSWVQMAVVSGLFPNVALKILRR